MPEARHMPARRWWRGASALISLVVMAAGLRCAVLAVQYERLALDPDAYRLIAENLRERGVYSRSRPGDSPQPTAFRPPLYPLLLAALAWQGHVTPASVAALHLVLGTLSVLLAWFLAYQWGLGSWSYLVGGCVACDPILLNQSTEVMTETLATFLALIGLLALTRLGQVKSWKAALMAGMALGTATLCRPTFLIWMALVTLWIVVSWGRWVGAKRAAVMLVGFSVVVAPWVIRNQRVMGRAILATTHGGYTLLLGNNPYFYRHLRGGRPGGVWDARQLLPLLEAEARSDTESGTPEGDNLGLAREEHPELVVDRRLYRLAQESIRREPGMFVYASLVRVLRFWTPLPHRLSDNESVRRAVARWGIAAWYTCVFLGALAGLWRLGRRAVGPPWLWGGLCLLALTAIHTVYWSNMRMRAPVMPVVYLAFALGGSGICAEIKCRKVFHRKSL